MIQIVFQGIVGTGNWKNDCQFTCGWGCTAECTEPEDYGTNYSSSMSTASKHIHN